MIWECFVEGEVFLEERGICSGDDVGGELQGIGRGTETVTEEGACEFQERRVRFTHVCLQFFLPVQSTCCCSWWGSLGLGR